MGEAQNVVLVEVVHNYEILVWGGTFEFVDDDVVGLGDLQDLLDGRGNGQGTLCQI